MSSNTHREPEPTALIATFLNVCRSVQPNPSAAFAWFWELDEHILSEEIDDLPDKSGDELPMEEDGKLTDAGRIYFRAWCRKEKLADV